MRNEGRDRKNKDVDANGGKTNRIQNSPKLLPSKKNESKKRERKKRQNQRGKEGKGDSGEAKDPGLSTRSAQAASSRQKQEDALINLL